MAVALKRTGKGGKSTASKTRVGVLMGGASAEREVSLESGRAVLESMLGSGVNAFPFDPSARGLGELLREKPTTAFLALHGKGGEDGTMQRRLESLGIRYTGSRPEASTLAMDKELTKRAFFRRGIPTPSYRVIRRDSMKEAERICNGMEFPLVIKPAGEGSSIGVTIADSNFDLYDGLEKAFRFGKRAIVESYVAGREFCIGVLGRETLPIVEVVYADDFFSYRAKYEDPRTAYIFDHGLPHRVARSMEAYALAAFDALGCRHYARVDMILSFGELTPYVLEVNTLPGMTGHSLMPMAARRCGLTFTDLCLRILNLAGEKGV